MFSYTTRRAIERAGEPDDLGASGEVLSDSDCLAKAQADGAGTRVDRLTGGRLGRGRQLIAARTGNSRFRIALLVLFIYGVLALAANWPAWPLDPNLFRQGDLTGEAWAVSWLPFAISHGHNPFFSTWMNYPVGVNLAQNNPPVVLAILAAPFTVLLGPAASVNLLDWLAYVLSAFSMFYVLRHFVRSHLAAFTGGLIYGFSTYMVGQGHDHLEIAFVPIPPLVFLVLYKLIAERDKSPVRLGLVLGVLVVVQFYIFSEIAFTTVWLTGCGLFVLAIAHPRRARHVFKRCATALLSAVAIAVAFLAYPFWAQAAGPYRYNGSAHVGQLFGISGDLAGTVVPTTLERFAPSRLVALGDQYLGGDVPENGLYFGVPLLLLYAITLLATWRDRLVRVAALMALIALLLTMGPYAVVDNHFTSIRLPDSLVMHLPFFGEVEAVELSLYIWLFVVLVLAKGIERVIVGRSRQREGAAAIPGRMRSPALRRLSTILLCALGAAALISLVPRWPNAESPAAIPAYFTSSAVNQIPAGSAALISPYPSSAELQPLLWQAAANMRFKIVGGYGWFRNVDGESTIFPTPLRPYRVEAWLWSEVAGGGSSSWTDAPKPAEDNAALVSKFRAFLRLQHVNVVLWTSVGTYPQHVAALFTSALGPPSYIGGGVQAWYGVQADLKKPAPSEAKRPSSTSP